MDPAVWFAPARLALIALMLALGLAAIYVEAAPLGLAADAWPSPDILFCVVAFWATRRPEVAALVPVFALGLVRDLLTDVPTGAGALGLVLVAEFLRSLSPRLARRGFVTEWLLLATLSGLMLGGQWALVLLLLAHPPYLIDLWYQWLGTMALYPVVALGFRWVLRIRWRRAEAL